MISFLTGILVMLVTFYVAFIYASPAIGLLGFAEMVLLLYAFFFLLYLRKKIHTGIRIPIAAADVGQKVTVKLKAENESRFPAMRIYYHIRSGNLFERKLHGKWRAGESVYHGKNVYSQSYCPQSVGNHAFELDKIRVYDLTGLFYMTRRVSHSASVLVLPEPVSVPVRISEQTRNFYGDSDIYDDFHPGDDSSEIFDVREFREGDRIQRIHWKLSAKSDTLLVREDSQPSACPLVFVLENWNRKKKYAMNQPKNYLSIAASIVFSLMDVQCPHYVAWYSESVQDIVRIRVDDEESYYMFLTSYMHDCYTKSPMETVQLYKEKFRYDHPVFWLHFTTDMELVLNERLLAKFDSREWKDKIEELEIIL